MKKINGTYRMTDWKETLLRDAPPPQKCTSVSAPGIFYGPLTGAGYSHYVLTYVSADTGLFYGYTFFEGSLDEYKGAFTLLDEGVFDAKAATTRWTIIAGSGAGDFAGISGSGGYSATQGLRIDFELVYDLPT